MSFSHFCVACVLFVFLLVVFFVFFCSLFFSTGRFMLSLALSFVLVFFFFFFFFFFLSFQYEPRQEKTCVRGLRVGKTQTGPRSHRD